MILFQKVRWKNFLSTGATFTEINFTKSTNTLIVGHNGAGKSTILDALCFGLFGKPFRNINKPQLLNSINQRDAVIEIEFDIGQKKYKIVRGIKPNKFEIYCNNVLLNQDAAAKDYQKVLEENILKLNYKSFTQVVILGSASFVPFMQMKASDRREIIEDLLDIQIFSTMNGVLKDKMSTLKDNMTKGRYAVDLIEEKIAMQLANIEEHKKHNDDEIAKKTEEVATSKKQLKNILNQVELINKHVDVLNNKLGDKKEKLEKKSKGLFQLQGKVETNIRKNEKDIEFYEHNDSCPTCKQSIEATFKQQQVDERKAKVATQQTGLAEITAELKNVTDEMTKVTEVVRHINEHNNEITKHNATMLAISKYIKKLQTEISELSVKFDDAEEGNDKLRDLKTDLSAQQQVLQDGAEEKQYLEYAATLLKDTGIKTKIIKQYLPVMNKLINKYLSAMDFFANFNLNENFEETIKSRHRDEFSYASFSEGEKMRIDLALLFTWRQIAKMKNSTNTNLLILDEVFDSSLDTVGTEEFLKLIHEMGKDTNVFVISHKGDQLFDKFRSVIKFEKKNNFSRISK
jgi:DNA repair exonuclease SbcCD ATPase subunit